MPCFWWGSFSPLILLIEKDCVYTQKKIATNQSLNLSPVVFTPGLTFFCSYSRRH